MNYCIPLNNIVYNFRFLISCILNSFQFDQSITSPLCIHKYICVMGKWDDIAHWTYWTVSIIGRISVGLVRRSFELSRVELRSWGIGMDPRESRYINITNSWKINQFCFCCSLFNCSKCTYRVCCRGKTIIRLVWRACWIST